jgi:CheY-like chemotaxis protein
MHLPVLILTSSEDIGDKEFCRQQGVIDFVSKPLTVGVVKRILGVIYPENGSY